MATILCGSPGALEQPLIYRIDRVNGKEYTRTWIGPESSINPILVQEQPLAESIQVSIKGATATLVARYAKAPDETEVPVETQELDTESLQQSIFLNKTFSGLPASVMEVTRRVFETKPEATQTETSYELAVAEIEGVTDTTDPTGTLNHLVLAIKAYDLLIMGTESFETHSFVLNRTQTVSRQYATPLALGNIDKVYSTEELATVTGNQLLFAIPSLTLTAEEATKNLFAGWRQKVCRVSDVSNGSRQMIEQWQLAKWSLDLYDRYTA